MFCTNCGAPTAAENKFCTQCGQVIAVSPAASATPATTPATPEQDPLRQIIEATMSVIRPLIAARPQDDDYPIYFEFRPNFGGGSIWYRRRHDGPDGKPTASSAITNLQIEFTSPDATGSDDWPIYSLVIADPGSAAPDYKLYTHWADEARDDEVDNSRLPAALPYFLEYLRGRLTADGGRTKPPEGQW